MRTADDQPTEVVDVRAPSHYWAYEVIVPPDGVIHPLNEIGFGFFTAADPPGSDRAIRAVMLENPVLQIPGGNYLHVGATLPGTPVAPGELPPGALRTWETDKLSTVGVANYTPDPILLVVHLVTLDL